MTAVSETLSAHISAGPHCDALVAECEQIPAARFKNLIEGLSGAERAVIRAG